MFTKQVSFICRKVCIKPADSSESVFRFVFVNINGEMPTSLLKHSENYEGWKSCQKCVEFYERHLCLKNSHK